MEEKCCATYEHWIGKYQECENSEQRQDEFGGYASPSNKVCDLWESATNLFSVEEKR